MKTALEGRFWGKRAETRGWNAVLEGTLAKMPVWNCVLEARFWKRRLGTAFRGRVFGKCVFGTAFWRRVSGNAGLELRSGGVFLGNACLELRSGGAFLETRVWNCVPGVCFGETRAGNCVSDRRFGKRGFGTQFWRGLEDFVWRGTRDGPSVAADVRRRVRRWRNDSASSRRRLRRAGMGRVGRSVPLSRRIYCSPPRRGGKWDDDVPRRSRGLRCGSAGRFALPGQMTPTILTKLRRRS
jgi:hypothetical protein